MPMRSSYWAGIAAVGVAVGLSACSSSPTANGLSSKSARQILSQALSAMKSAKSVTLSGSVTSNGSRVGLNLGLTASGAISGSIEEFSQKLQVVILSSKDYVKAPAAFWQRSAHLSAAQADRIAPHWIVAPSAVTSSFSSLSLPALTQSLSTDNGTLSKGGAKTIDGHPTVGVNSSKGGTLWVSSSGTPYPVALTGALGSSSADVSFSKWNSTATPVAPKNATSASSVAGA